MKIRRFRTNEPSCNQNHVFLSEPVTRETVIDRYIA